MAELCGKIREAGLIPGVLSTQLTGNTFSTVFNLEKTDWLATMEGVNWERDFLDGKGTAVGMWCLIQGHAVYYGGAGWESLGVNEEEHKNEKVVWSDHGNAVGSVTVRVRKGGSIRTGTGYSSFME
ncbi:MAG: hypothetical protein NC094_07045 [Bacteroidales bacterium]|nr:hypothetical protein [Lachnoclostridium sp.]MCM1384559.1 hypothetical protein [Lachnoclostridium sp.]MCM1465159.1 hypothetical protein [Bacteroidales bacterium]